MLVPKHKWKPCELYAPGAAPPPINIEIIPQTLKPDIPEIIIEIDPPLPKPSNKLPPGVISGTGVHGLEPVGLWTKPDQPTVCRSLIRRISNGGI